MGVYVHVLGTWVLIDLGTARGPYIHVRGTAFCDLCRCPCRDAPIPGGAPPWARQFQDPSLLQAVQAPFSGARQFDPSFASCAGAPAGAR